MRAPTDWKALGAGLAAMLAAFGAGMGGGYAGRRPADLARVTYVQVKALKARPHETPGWKSWTAVVTYRDELGLAQKDIPVQVDVEAP